MELGLYTFGDMRSASGTQRMQELLEEIELADQLGLDVFGIGEHHRPEYVVSAPEVALGAAAVRTKQIRLASAVTVLSHTDASRLSVSPAPNLSSAIVTRYRPHRICESIVCAPTGCPSRPSVPPPSVGYTGRWSSGTMTARSR